jgi:hypothetical protein
MIGPCIGADGVCDQLVGARGSGAIGGLDRGTSRDVVGVDPTLRAGPRRGAVLLPELHRPVGVSLGAPS